MNFLRHDHEDLGDHRDEFFEVNEAVVVPVQSFEIVRFSLHCRKVLIINLLRLNFNFTSCQQSFQLSFAEKSVLSSVNFVDPDKRKHRSLDGSGHFQKLKTVASQKLSEFLKVSSCFYCCK